jgi:hypothetical protein
VWFPVPAPHSDFNGPCRERGGFVLASQVANGSATWRIFVAPSTSPQAVSMHQANFVDVAAACRWADEQIERWHKAD